MTRTFEGYGRREGREKISDEMYRFIQAQLLVAIPLVCWAIFSSAPFIIRQVTPLYAGGIFPMAILLVASFFDMRNNNLVTIWMAEKRLKSYGKANLLSLVGMLTSVSVCWFVVGNRTLGGLAVAVVAGYLINFIYLLSSVGREVLGPARATRLLFLAMAGALWTAGVLIWFALREPLHMGFSEDILFSAKKAIVIFLLVLPVVLIGLRSSGLGGLLLRRWLKRGPDSDIQLSKRYLPYE